MSSPITLKSTIDRILVQDCPIPLPYPPPVPPPYPPGVNPYPANIGAYPPNIGYEDPCLSNKLWEVLSMIDSLIQTYGRQILDKPVLTFVPNQGRTDITILESAIVMRWPRLVRELLKLGVNPNISTAGVPLVTQLRQSQGDPYSPDFILTQEIIGILLYGPYWYPTPPPPCPYPPGVNSGYPYPNPY